MFLAVLTAAYRFWLGLSGCRLRLWAPPSLSLSTVHGRATKSYDLDKDVETDLVVAVVDIFAFWDMYKDFRFVNNVFMCV